MTSTPAIAQKISYLIRLMDDCDSFVRGKVREQLIGIGGDAAPFLQIAAHDENPARRSAAREILDAIAPRQIGEKLRRLSFTPGPTGDIDLETGVFLLMQHGYPNADPAESAETLDKLALELSSRIGPEAQPLAVVQRLTEFLFAEKGFCGNEKNYFHPDNSYFNKVLQNRTGIPITLSALCIFIARRLGHPIVGLGLPYHFIVKYDSPTDPIYFDPCHKGRILSRKDCVSMVEGFGAAFEERFLLPNTGRQILVRMINNLVMVYRRNKQPEKESHLLEYMQILGRRI